MNILNGFQDLWFLFYTAPLVIKVALGVIAFVVSLFIVMLTITALSYAIDRIKKRNYKKLNGLHRELAVDILSSKEIFTPSEIQIAYANHCGRLNYAAYYSLVPTCQELLEKDPSLQQSPNFRTFISALGIDNHLETKLGFSSVASKLKTFHQLSRFKVLIADSKILPYTFSRNRFIKKASRSAYIGVSNNNPFKFFDQQDNQINYWDQIILLEQLEHHHKDNLPNFSNWLKYSKNDSQTIFLIKAASHFKQYGCVKALIALLDEENPRIREEAIKALGIMQVQKVENKLINLYNSQPNACKDAIIEAIFNINSKNASDFLKEAFEQSPNYESKKLIAEVLYSYEDKDHKTFNELMEVTDGFNKRILEHVRNPLNKLSLTAPESNNVLLLDNNDPSEDSYVIKSAN